MREPKVYTCNCKTPLYQAAPEMYEFIEWLRTVEGQCVILKAKNICRKFWIRWMKF